MFVKILNKFGLYTKKQCEAEFKLNNAILILNKDKDDSFCFLNGNIKLDIDSNLMLNLNNKEFWEIYNTLIRGSQKNV